MALRSQQLVPSTASQVLVRVDDTGDGRFAGLVYHPYLDKTAQFSDVVELTAKLDAIFDALAFPQAAAAYRGTAKRGRRARAIPTPAPDADIAGEKLHPDDPHVFMVHVKFRRNADWQGNVKRPGQAVERRFESTLELLRCLAGTQEMSQ